MKFILVSTLMALTAASAADFPKFNILQTHCQLQTEVEASCDQVWTAVDKAMRNTPID